MAPSATEIATLLKTERYSASIIPKLEGYLVSQVQQNSTETPAAYDSDANRALIKLYQFFPDQAKNQYILLAESLALVYGTATKEGSLDFGSLGCLINESIKKDEPYPTLIRCADLIDACQFNEFWTIFHTIEANSTDYDLVAKLSKSIHARNALQTSILNTLSLTYKSTKLSNVCEQIDIEAGSSESDDFFKGAASVVEKVDAGSDVIIFCDNVGNTKRDKVSQEGGTDYGMIRALVMGNKTRAAAE
jgi:translation initiation factor 3 subunit K